jgi:hypothetical protein
MTELGSNPATLVVVEGMDNSGKTTLVKQLSEHIKKSLEEDGVNIPLHLYSSSVEVENHFMRLYVILDDLNKGSVVITDRISLIGEEVYGRLLRGQSVFGDKDGYLGSWDLFLQAATAMNRGNTRVVIIYCNPDPFPLSVKMEMPGVSENFNILKTRYNLAFHDLTHHLARNWTKPLDTPDTVISEEGPVRYDKSISLFWYNWQSKYESSIPEKVKNIVFREDK